MADTNNFEDIKAGFGYITEILDSMRAQNAMNAGNADKVLVNINKTLESLSNEENSDLIKVFLSELKKSLEERHNFVASKFTEIEDSFKVIVEKTENQLKGSEIKEVFDIIATNLNVFSKDFSSQKDLITEIGLKLEELKEDDSQKRDILRNIAVLKVELEKFSNGFESIILNLNNNFKETAQVLAQLDSHEELSGLKKDIDNVYLSSNAILSTLQVIDRKNRELEEVITHVVTKEDFNLEREQVAKLITQNIQIADYIATLPKQSQVEALSERVDTAVGVINALKNMLNDTGKQNQKLLTAQLDNLESKILNISTEEEFIGFRKELAEFSQEVIQSTNLMRSDLDDTKTELKDLMAFLSSMNIKESFETFANLSKVTEKNIKENISEHSANLVKEMEKNKNITKADVAQSTSTVSEKIELAKMEIAEGSKSNLSTILEHLQSVISNVFSVKNALHVENIEIAEAVDTKLNDLKESLVASNNFIVQNSQDNLENIVSKVEKVFQEITTVKENLSESSSTNIKNLGGGFSQISKKIEELKEELNQNSQESFANILSIVEDFSTNISTVKTAIEQSSQENSEEIKGFISTVEEKLGTLKEVLKEDAVQNSNDVKSSIDSIIQTVKFLKNGIEQTSATGFANIGSNFEEMANKLESVHDHLSTKSESNLAMLVGLFEELSKEFNEHKAFLSETAQINFETVSLYIQNLNKRIEESKSEFSEGLKQNISELQSSISALPETIKENQIVFENEKRTLIEENSKSIEQLGERIQSLVKGIISKDNPFKENILGEFEELKSAVSKVKEDVAASNSAFGENVEILVNESLVGVENSISQYSEKYNQSLLSLQNRLGEYFENIQSASQENDLKLVNSLKEAGEIKEEIKSIIELLSELKEDSTLTDFSIETGKKFEGILLNITQLEEIFSSKNRESLQNVLSALDAKFEAVSTALKNQKNFTTTEINEVLSELEEKTASLKTEIGLTGSDVLSALSTKTEEIISSLYPISDSVERLCSFDFEEFSAELKDQIEDSYSSIKTALEENIKGESGEQLEKIQAEFLTLGEKLETITTKIYSNKTDEFEELKSALNSVSENLETVSESVNDKIEEAFFIENFTSIKHSIASVKIQNADAINGAFKTLLAEIEKLNLASESFEENILDSKEAIFERLDGIKERLLEAGEDTKASLASEIIDAQNEAKEAILGEFQDSLVSMKEKLVTSQETAAAEILENLEEKIADLKEGSSAAYSLVNQTIETSLSSSNEKIFEKLEALEEKVIETQDSAKTQLLEELAQTHAETKSEIISEIIKTRNETEATILEELGENITFIKEVMDTLSADKSLDEEFDRKLDAVQTSIQSTSKGIENKIATSQETYKTTTQTLLSEVKTSFYEKVDDSLDELRSFIEILEDKNDISTVVDTLRTDVFDKFNELTGSLEASINSISVKEELEEVNKNLEASINDLFANVEEKFTSIINENEKINGISEKSEELNRRIEELKKVVTDEITEKIDNFELHVDTKNQEFSTSLSEMSAAMEELKESFIDLSLNSNMEMSSALMSVQEKIEGMYETLNGLASREDICETLNGAKNEINENLSKGIESVHQKLDSEVAENLNRLNENLAGDFEAIHQKLDSLNVEPDQELANNVREIKDVVLSQSGFIEKIERLEELSQLEKLSKLDDLSSLEKLAELEGLSNVKSEIQSALGEFKEKLDVFASDKEGAEEASNTIKDTLNGFKEELFENLIEIFNQISFVEESEDIKDFIEEKTDGIKDEILEALNSQTKETSYSYEPSDSSASGEEYGSIGDIKAFVDITKRELKESLKTSLGTNFEEIISSLDILHEKTGSVDHNCFNLVNEIKEIKNNLSSVKGGDVSDYSYTLQDVECDIAKMRLALKEISQSKSEVDLDKFDSLSRLEELDKLNNLDKLNDDITSISTRTNKLLLNSDESYSVLKDNLSDFKHIIYQLEERIRHIDNTDTINGVDKKLDNINKLMVSSVNSDKIFNQTFMYLAEWIDKADEKLATIEAKLSDVNDIKQSIATVQKSMLKSSDLDALFDKFAKKFDQQQTKINSLEAMVDKLNKKAPAKATKDTDLKTLVKEVLALTERPESKADAKLAKKVDNIDKQLATFGKSIEKITSYVD